MLNSEELCERGVFMKAEIIIEVSIFCSLFVLKNVTRSSPLPGCHLLIAVVSEHLSALRKGAETQHLGFALSCFFFLMKRILFILNEVKV